MTDVDHGSLSPSTGSSNSLRTSNSGSSSKKNHPNRVCHTESEAIIDFLEKSYEKNARSLNGNKVQHPSTQNQFKNLKKELLSFVRRLRRSKKNGNHGLLEVLTKEDETKCLIIRRNLDGRIQVDGRKVWPHAFMYHIYVTFLKGDTDRTLSSGNHSELRSKSNLEVPCQFPFSNDKTEEQTHLCINPLHYEEKLKIEVNHYVPKSSLTETPKALAWAKSGQTTVNLENGSRAENMLPPASANVPKQRVAPLDKKKKDKNTIIIEDGLLDSLSRSEKLWSRPQSSSRYETDSAHMEKAKGIVNFSETIARAAEKRSLHNTRSRSPNQNRKLHQEMLQKCHVEQQRQHQQYLEQRQRQSNAIQIEQSDNSYRNEQETQDFAVQNIKDQLQGIELSETLQQTGVPTTFADSFPDDFPVNDAYTEQFNVYEMDSPQNLQMQMPVPNEDNIIGEDAEYYTLVGPLFLTEDPTKPWLRITYYECNNKRKSYDSNRDNIHLYFNQINRPQHNKSKISDVQQFDLAEVKNVNRSADAWDVLEKLGKGISVTYDRNTRLVTCANNSSMTVYILSSLINIKCTQHEQSLLVIKPGSQRVVYDGPFLIKLINELNAQTGTNDDAEKWALAAQYSTFFTAMSIAFQPWGPEHLKNTLVECDVWIEVQMLDYLDLISRMQDHYEDITNNFN